MRDSASGARPLFPGLMAQHLDGQRLGRFPIRTTWEAAGLLRFRFEEAERTLQQKDPEAAAVALLELAALCQRVAEDVLLVGPDDSPLVSVA